MAGFYSFNTLATQKRLGAYSSGKASYSATSNTFSGEFNPIDPAMSLNMGLAGQAYMFNTIGTADIKASDILTIGGVDYAVKGIARYSQASIDILKCTLVLPVKA